MLLFFGNTDVIPRKHTPKIFKSFNYRLPSTCKHLPSIFPNFLQSYFFTGLVQQSPGEMASRGKTSQPEEGCRTSGREPTCVRWEVAHQLGLQLHVLFHTTAHRHDGRQLQVRQLRDIYLDLPKIRRDDPPLFARVGSQSDRLFTFN